MSIPVLVVLIAGAIVIVGVVALVVATRRPRDGVDSFRRQIDALSPEARRGVVDQIQSVTVRPEPGDPTGTPAADQPAPESPTPGAADGDASELDVDDGDTPDDGSNQRGA